MGLTPDIMSTKGDSCDPDRGVYSSPLAEIQRKRSPPREDPKKAPKMKKRRKKEAVDRDDEMGLSQNFNAAIGRMDSHLLADYFIQRTKRFGPDLSHIELQDRLVTEKAFLDTSPWQRPRNLDNLPAFLENFTSKPNARNRLSSSPTATGSPHTLVVTVSGMRAADICRSLKLYRTKESSVAKLFAKHIKLKDAIAHVKQTRISIAVGTPIRLNDLINAGALSISCVERIIVDGSYIDQKKRGILDIRETQPALIALLCRPDVKARYGEGDKAIQVLCY